MRRASFTGTKFGGGGKARAGKNSFPPTPFLFARLRQRRTGDLNLFQNSASGFLRKKFGFCSTFGSQAVKSGQKDLFCFNFQYSIWNIGARLLRDRLRE